MELDVNSTSINPAVNRQLLEHVGMETVWAPSLAAAITALNAQYRLNAFDARWAWHLLQAGETDMAALAQALEPLPVPPE